MEVIGIQEENQEENGKENQKGDERSLEVLVRFLIRTRKGRYAPVDEYSLQFARMEERTVLVEDQYYYFGIA